MAFTVDQANLGTVVNAGSNLTSFTLTTSQVAAANALIVIGFGTFQNNASTYSAAGGSLAWTTTTVGQGASGDIGGLTWARTGAGGLASATVVTITDSVSNNFSAPCAVAASWLGSAASPADGTATKASTTITSGVWTGNPVSLTGSSDLVVAAAWGDGQSTTTAGDTASGGYTGGPVASQVGALGGVATIVSLMNVASSGTPGGTWSAGLPANTAVVSAGFLAAGGGAAPFGRPNLPFMVPQGGL